MEKPCLRKSVNQSVNNQSMQKTLVCISGCNRLAPGVCASPRYATIFCLLVSAENTQEHKGKLIYLYVNTWNIFGMVPRWELGCSSLVGRVLACYA